VEVGHTFYVGELKTWVHNVGPCGTSSKSGTENGLKVPQKLQPFSNSPQAPVIPSNWISGPGKTPGSVIYYPPWYGPKHCRKYVHTVNAARLNACSRFRARVLDICKKGSAYKSGYGWHRHVRGNTYAATT